MAPRQTLGTEAVKKGLNIVPHVPGTKGSGSCYLARNPHFSSFAEERMQKLRPVQCREEVVGIHWPSNYKKRVREGLKSVLRGQKPKSNNESIRQQNAQLTDHMLTVMKELQSVAFPAPHLP